MGGYLKKHIEYSCEIFSKLVVLFAKVSLVLAFAKGSSCIPLLTLLFT